MKPQTNNNTWTRLSKRRLISRATARRQQLLSCCWGFLLGWRCWWVLRLLGGFGWRGMFGGSGNVNGLILWIFGRRMVVFEMKVWVFGAGPWAWVFKVHCREYTLGDLGWWQIMYTLLDSFSGRKKKISDLVFSQAECWLLAKMPFSIQKLHKMHKAHRPAE